MSKRVADMTEEECEKKRARDAVGRAANREKIAERQRAYTAAHREEIRAQKAAYRAAHAEKLAAYRAANAEKIAKRKADYGAANREKLTRRKAVRYATDPLFKLERCLRSRLYAAIKGKTKPGSAVRDLGCTGAEFKAYIEAQFTPWQNWENHGKRWHLDHIEPVSAFDPSDLTPWYFTNYQPLDAADNLAKSAKTGIGRQLW
jgi:hypothetical protein